MRQLWSKLKKATAANVGDVAPDFTLRGTRGDEVRLSSFRGQRRVLLLFYPQDQTSG
jgi:peroxiredoxin Q/BCP